jgi:hypothetical protein
MWKAGIAEAAKSCSSMPKSPSCVTTKGAVLCQGLVFSRLVPQWYEACLNCCLALQQFQGSSKQQAALQHQALALPCAACLATLCCIVVAFVPLAYTILCSVAVLHWHYLSHLSLLLCGPAADPGAVTLHFYLGRKQLACLLLPTQQGKVDLMQLYTVFTTSAQLPLP